MTEKNTVLKIGHIDMTMEQVEDYFGMSDSDGSDWEDMKEVMVDNFMVVSPEKKVEEKKRIFEKVEQTKVAKSIKTPEKVTKKPFKMPIKNNEGYFVAIPTNIRVMNAKITTEVWKERIAEREVVPVSMLSRGNRAERLAESDWIMVGVIAQKSGTKKTKTDKNYSTWLLNDLQCLEKVARFMLFSDVHSALWKEPEGTVVAVLRPRLMKSERVQKEQAFTVDVAAQVIVLGQSPDFGTCEGRTKAGDKCNNIVNKGDCGLCTFHIQQGYSAALSRPGFSDIMKEKISSRKRVSQKQEWQIPAKKPNTAGVFTNNTTSTSMSMEKLHKAGVTAAATNWGLLDKTEIAKMGDKANNNSNTGDTSVKLSQKDIKFAGLLKKHGAGSMNFVKCLAEQSCGTSAISSNIIKQSRLFDNGRPTVAKGVTCASVLEGFKTSRTIKRDDSGKYIELGLEPEDLSKVSAAVYKAELSKLRACALVKSKGGYEAFKESNRLEHLRNMGKVKEQQNSQSEKNNNNKSNIALSSDLLKLLHQKSSNKHLVDQNKEIEFEKKMDNLEEIEKMELKMCSIHKRECFYYYCVNCKAKSSGRPTICVVEGHSVEKRKGFKRFFRCLKCKHRLMTLERYPGESCFKCGAAVFEKTGMFKENEVVQEKPLIDGGEKRFIHN